MPVFVFSENNDHRLIAYHLKNVHLEVAVR